MDSTMILDLFNELSKVSDGMANVYLYSVILNIKICLIVCLLSLFTAIIGFVLGRNFDEELLFFVAWISTFVFIVSITFLGFCAYDYHMLKTYPNEYIIKRIITN